VIGRRDPVRINMPVMVDPRRLVARVAVLAANTGLAMVGDDFRMPGERRTSEGQKRPLTI
jgi:hypothetical protein